jgi:hypothetical protein
MPTTKPSGSARLPAGRQRRRGSCRRIDRQRRVDHLRRASGLARPHEFQAPADRNLAAPRARSKSAASSPPRSDRPPGAIRSRCATRKEAPDLQCSQFTVRRLPPCCSWRPGWRRQHRRPEQAIDVRAAFEDRIGEGPKARSRRRLRVSWNRPRISSSASSPWSTTDRTAWMRSPAAHSNSLRWLVCSSCAHSTTTGRSAQCRRSPRHRRRYTFAVLEHGR